MVLDPVRRGFEPLPKGQRIELLAPTSGLPFWTGGAFGFFLPGSASAQLCPAPFRSGRTQAEHETGRQHPRMFAVPNSVLHSYQYNRLTGSLSALLRHPRGVSSCCTCWQTGQHLPVVGARAFRASI